ncbi:hypothetical protein ANAPC5_01023 [Anaplasma phagocytophilum]|nr:hypothetical protein ANAPC5_01023 [Anaplasma phagocytophilum]
MVFSSRLRATRSLATALALSLVLGVVFPPVDVGQFLLPSVRVFFTKSFKT